MHPARPPHSTELLSCAMLTNLRGTTVATPYIWSDTGLGWYHASSSTSRPQQKMAPHSNRTDSFTTTDSHAKPKLAKASPPRNVDWIEQVSWDSSLQPKDYDIQGTHPDSKILFLNVNILDSTGKEPYLGDVLVEGQKHTFNPVKYRHQLTLG